MGIINRFLLFIYAAVALLVSLFAVALATKALPDDVLLNEIMFFLHQSATVTALGVFAAFSVYFLLYTFFVGEKKKSAPKDTNVIIKTPAGEVRIARNAIESLTNREATSITGVREAYTKVITSGKEGEAKLSLNISLILLAGANVPAISAEVTNSVKNRIFESLGEKDTPVSLSVRELNSAPAENQKRVH